jgi:hypothetical protein
VKPYFEQFTSVKEFVVTNSKTIVMVSLLLVTIPIAKNYILKWFGWDDQKADGIISQLFGYTGDSTAKRSEAKKLSKNRFLAKTKASAKAQVTSGTIDKAVSLTRRNLLKIVLFNGDTEIHQGFGIHLFNDLVLLPSHYIMNWQDRCEKGERNLTIFFYKGDHRFYQHPITLVENQDLLVLDERLLEHDLIIIKVPGMNPCRDIRSDFPSDTDIRKLASRFEVCYFDPDRKFMSNTRASLYKQELMVRHEMVDYLVVDSICYDADTKAGDCGLPIVCQIQNNKHVILGIHIAGIPVQCKAYAGLISRDVIMDVTSQFSVIHDEILDEVFAESQMFPDHLTDRFYCYGKAKDGSHFPEGYSSIRRSPVHIQNNPFGFKPPTAIANLRRNERFDPYEIALKKYGVSRMNFECESFDAAFESAKELILNLPYDPYEKVTIPLHEALWGDSEDSNWNSMKSTSSIGYPLKYNQYKNLKKELFGEDCHRGIENPAYDVLLEMVDDSIEKMRKGRRLVWIYTDNLKDETLPAEKVKEGKARQFNGCNLVYFSLVRIYFGNFIKCFMGNKLDNETALGINVYSADWHDMSKRMLRFGDTEAMIAGDFSGFDATELAYIHWKIYEVIESWYGDSDTEDSRIRKILWYEVVNSRHVAYDSIYEWCGSLPSGNPLTTIINCLYNIIAYRYCFHRATGKASEFRNYCQLFVLGDDNICSVHERYREVFNENTIGTFMSELGLSYTREDKRVGDANAPILRNLRNISFLKRTFRFEPLVGKWIGSLDVKSIISIPCWTKKGVNSLGIFHTNVLEFCHELALHEDEVYDKYIALMYKALRHCDDFDWDNYPVKRLRRIVLSERVSL